MKYWLGFVLLLSVITGISQKKDTKQIDKLEREAQRKKKLMVMFERVDTAVEGGGRFQVARSYYFSAKNKDVVYITALEYASQPQKGLQVFYTFSGNKWAKVKVVPARHKCTKCSAAYYFANDCLYYKKEQTFAVSDVPALLDDAKKLRAKLLPSLQDYPIKF